MDPQLPRLDDFKAIEAEPLKPERWWVRYYSYVFTTFLCAVGFGGYTLLSCYGLVGNLPPDLSLATGAEKHAVILNLTCWSAVTGALLGLAISYSFEITRKKCRPKTPTKS